MSSIDVSLYWPLYPSPLHSFTWLPLVCPLIWLSSLCQSVPFLFSSFSLLLIPFRWLYFFISLLSSPQLNLSLPPASLPLCLFLSELDLARLSQVWVSYFDFLFPVLFILLFHFFVFVFYTGSHEGRACRMDWWMARCHGSSPIWSEWCSCNSQYLMNWIVCFCKKVVLWKHCWLC